MTMTETWARVQTIREGLAAEDTPVTATHEGERFLVSRLFVDGYGSWRVDLESTDLDGVDHLRVLVRSLDDVSVAR